MELWRQELSRLGLNRQCKEEVPEVPSQVIMKDRQVVDTRSSVWRFRASLDGGKIIRLNWQHFSSHASPLVPHFSVVHLAQAYLSSKMRYSKGSSIRNDFIALGRLLKWAGANTPRDSFTEFKWEMLRERDFRLFLESGLQTSSRGNDFAHVRDFYAWCCFVAEADGFEPQLALSLKNVRAQGNVKGGSRSVQGSRARPIAFRGQRFADQSGAVGLRNTRRPSPDHASSRVRSKPQRNGSHEEL